MAKKAFLVTFSITTRVVVDDDENAGDKAAELAVDKVRGNYANYIIQDNVDGVEYDTDCPYGTLEEE